MSKILSLQHVNMKIINRIILVVRELNTIESNLTVPLPVGPLFESHSLFFFSFFQKGKHLKFLSWSWVGLLFLLFLFFFLLSGWLLLGNWRNYWCHTRICPSKTNKTLLDVICHSSLTTRPGLTSLAQGLGKRKEQEKC